MERGSGMPEGLIIWTYDWVPGGEGSPRGFVRDIRLRWRAKRRSQRLSKPVASDPNIELAFWDSVKDANDPHALEAYLAKFPDGEFKDLAELRLKSWRD